MGEQRSSRSGSYRLWHGAALQSGRRRRTPRPPRQDHARPEGPRPARADVARQGQAKSAGVHRRQRAGPRQGKAGQGKARARKPEDLGPAYDRCARASVGGRPPHDRRAHVCRPARRVGDLVENTYLPCGVGASVIDVEPCSCVHLQGQSVDCATVPYRPWNRIVSTVPDTGGTDERRVRAQRWSGAKPRPKPRPEARPGEAQRGAARCGGSGWFALPLLPERRRQTGQPGQARPPSAEA
ncbi:uncharacterized protein PSFLO_02209 [Pseudozyma flocculosa]|uniref:Uncharacterized protein n=1 Tax=Pseudozyma flocculosa TaxID=84751 RepID=A0A5C3EWZ3_9BASI|nr:uncharacterized protein PSFLO_02209 [Pseudozyma flocculosa]